MFPQRLRELRIERGLSATELGEHFSLAVSTISGYEKGARNPDLEIIEKFANFFDVSIDYLLGKSKVRKPSATEEIPLVGLLMRTKEEIPPEDYAVLEKTVEGLAKAFKEKVDREADGEKK